MAPSTDPPSATTSAPLHSSRPVLEFVNGHTCGQYLTVEGYYECRHGHPRPRRRRQVTTQRTSPRPIRVGRPFHTHTPRPNSQS